MPYENIGGSVTVKKAGRKVLEVWRWHTKEAAKIIRKTGYFYFQTNK